MIKATLHTPNFTFEAYGPTTAHAVNALTRGLARHAVQYDLMPLWYEPANIETHYFDTCVAYRDGEKIK